MNKYIFFYGYELGDSFEGHIEGFTPEDIKVVKVAYLRWNLA